jgi:Domain of unknown function (DUF1772)
MNLILDPLLFLSALSLGLLSGALLTEAMVLIPMWRSIQAQEFFERHAQHGRLLYRYFAPLTILGTCSCLFAAIASYVCGHPGRQYAIASAVAALSLLAIYYLFFRRANAAFSLAVMSPLQLRIAHERWAARHWLRTVIALLSFGLALLALRGVP